MMGFIILFGGGPIIFGSKKQHSVAISTAEAEYVAASESMKETMAIVHLIEEVNQHFSIKLPTVPLMLTDSSACKAIIERGTTVQGRMKHINVQVHWILQAFQEGKFEVKWIAGVCNISLIY